jgi:uncharacterized phage protein (TIGR02218 family)
MRTLPSGLGAHLTGSVTTLARCYIVRRVDGVTLGFTDHDRPLTVDGVLCEPDTGLSSSEAVAEAGFAVGGLEVMGALSSSTLTERDLTLGRYDDATVDTYLVNWTTPSEVLHERRARIGDVTRRDGVFRAELRSLLADYDAPRGRLIRATCDARFGDQRCGKSLTGVRHNGPVLSISDLRVLRIGVTLAGGLLRKGELKFNGGPLAGTVHSIRDHERNGSTAIITLAEPLSLEPSIGVTVQLTQGCDKTYETCRDRYENQLNFRGFPSIPGNDFVYSHPTRRGGENTGGRR